MRVIFSFIMFMLSSFIVSGQTVEMASNLRSSGKIYVVVAVLLIVLVGLFIYLFALDKRISILENKKDE